MRHLLSILLAVTPLTAFELPRDTTQIVVGITESWQSSHVSVALFERTGSGRNGGGWKQVTAPTKGRVGKKGLAWGRGIHPIPKGAATKREGDWRAPAGVFRIGDAWGYATSIRKQPGLRYTKVTTRNLWVEDPSSPYYNLHLALDREPSAAWEKKAQMKQNDYPHSLKLFIAHNAPLPPVVGQQPKPVPGAGSSIFFHIWRNGGASPSSGCTTLPEPRLQEIIARIDPAQKPLYVLLPRPEYEKLRKSWKLP
jgi:L,D-peptidoglycan transpeptidase YkuD (ErfK/YbiS/YcfS/YnhG family)